MLLVVGSGGNGQTYFMEFLNKNNIKTNHLGDKDNMKHAATPNCISQSDLNKVTKCIFLFNQPYKSIVSHFKRKWQIAQVKKLGNPYGLKNFHLENINIYNNLVIKTKKDLFGIENQFVNWYNSNQNFPIFFLDFNEIISKKQELQDFIESPLNFDFFEVKKRNTDNSIELLKSPTQVKKFYYNSYKKIKNIVHLKRIILPKVVE
jgi:hypothetical protein